MNAGNFSFDSNFKLQVDTASALLKDLTARKFDLDGSATRTLSVALGHRDVRHFFADSNANETLKAAGFISKASDSFRHLWSAVAPQASS